MTGKNYGPKSGKNVEARGEIVSRCLTILDYLKRGEKVTKQELADEFGLKNEKSIGNYINGELKKYNIGVKKNTKKPYLYFKDPSEIFSNDKVKLPVITEKKHIQHIKSSLEQLKEISHEAKQLSIELEDKLDLENVNSPYFVKPQSFQILYHKKYSGMLTDLYDAINGKSQVKIVYDYRDTNNELENMDELKQKDTVETLIIDPYQISSFEGIWYLSAYSKEDQSIRQFMLYRIDDYKPLSKLFNYNEDTFMKISKMQSSHTLESKSIEIKIRVKERIADYFEAKKHLTSQKNSTPEENGDLIVCFQITHLEEVDNLIKEWLPDIEILEPLAYKEKVRYELSEYLKKM